MENDITGNETLKIPFGDLRRQYLKIKEEIDNAIQGVLASGWFILGKELEGFEREFAQYCDSTYGIGVGSGTEALHLALRACGVKEGDEVITVPNTAVPTVCAIVSALAKAVFIDVDPSTYTMDPQKLHDYLKNNYNKRLKAVVPVHLYGHPADMSPILEICETYGLKVVEDACQAHGALYKGQKVGSMGNVGCFSFYPTKNLGAYGDAGMIVTKDIAVAQKLLQLRNYGEKKKYYNISEGFNSRLDELQAAVLRIKLSYLTQWNNIRRDIAATYGKLLEGASVVCPVEKDYDRHVYHLYVIKTPNRDKLREGLDRKGIGTSIHYPLPIHLQPAYRHLGYAIGSLPIAERLSGEILSLPIYPELCEDEIQYVCNSIHQLYQKAKSLKKFLDKK